MMPKLVVPPIEPMQSDIEQFAKAYFNIELTSYQLEVAAMFAKNKLVASLPPRHRQTGMNTVAKVLQAYIAEGVKPGGRVRLPEHPLPPIDKKPLKGLTQEGRILAMIKRPGGAYNFELSRFALKYTSVISELRKDGHDIVADRQYRKGRATNTWRYRLGGH